MDRVVQWLRAKAPYAYLEPLFVGNMNMKTETNPSLMARTVTQWLAAVLTQPAVDAKECDAECSYGLHCLRLIYRESDPRQGLCRAHEPHPQVARPQQLVLPAAETASGDQRCGRGHKDVGLCLVHRTR